MRRTERSSLRLWALAISVVLLWVAPIAHANELDSAKQAGQVAEGPDGYLHVVNPGSTQVTELVKDINAKRKAKYQEIASQDNAPLDAVAVLAGKKLLLRVPAGQYVMDANGNFRKK